MNTVYISPAGEDNMGSMHLRGRQLPCNLYRVGDFFLGLPVLIRGVSGWLGKVHVWGMG